MIASELCRFVAPAETVTSARRTRLSDMSPATRGSGTLRPSDQAPNAIGTYECTAGPARLWPTASAIAASSTSSASSNCSSVITSGISTRMTLLNDPVESDDYAVLVAVTRDLAGFVGGRLAGPGLHQFDGAHATQSADVADDGPAPLPSAGALLEVLAQAARRGRTDSAFRWLRSRQVRRRRTTGLPAKVPPKSAGSRRRP